MNMRSEVKLKMELKKRIRIGDLEGSSDVGEVRNTATNQENLGLLGVVFARHQR